MFGIKLIKLLTEQPGPVRSKVGTFLGMSP